MGKIHWMALVSVHGIGGATVRELLKHFGSVEAVFEADRMALQAVPRLTPKIIEGLRNIAWESIESELASLENDGISVLTWDDPGYPAGLKELRDAPPVLYVRGRILSQDAQAVAIVGTRKPSPASVQCAEKLAGKLASRELTIVSGLAMGIDAAAHRGALQAEDGRTLAVLGSGLRIIHPQAEANLAEAIIEHGALISELHPNTPPRGPQLMARDRIIAALARGVIVIEAEEGSGSLDTAVRARKLGRPLWAVPGSPGTEWLIANGATPLNCEALEIQMEELVGSLNRPQTSRPCERSLFDRYA